MASTYLTKSMSGNTPSKKMTFSAWIKKSYLTASGFSSRLFGTRNANHVYIHTEYVYFDVTNTSDSWLGGILTNAKLRDTNGWYHIVASLDTTLSTATDRQKIYINGERQSVTINKQIAQDDISDFGANGVEYSVGGRTSAQGGAGGYFDGLMSHVHYCDGYAYDASDFGETDTTTGIWKPKTAPSVTYGTNGFFLKFENSGAMGTDSSGNSNTFTVNGTMTQLIDTPSNVFATLNPLARSTTSGSFSNGNTTHTKSDGVWASTTSTLAASSGKYYAEYKFTANSSSSNGQMAAIVNMDLTNYMNENSDLEQSGNKGITYYPNGTVFADPQTTVATYSSYGDAIIQIAMDLDNGFLYFGKDGTWQNSGVPTSGATGTGGINISNYIGTGTYAFGLANRNTGSTSVNFGNGYFGTTAVSSAQNPDDGIGIFEYDVPAGYRALCTKSINAQEYD